MTRYDVETGNNSWSGGSKIIPLSYEGALEWAEKYFSADEYIKVFGMPDGDDESIQKISINVPADIAAKICSEVKSSGRLFTDVILSHLDI